MGVSGNWGKFSTVRLHSRFGSDGADGRGFEHIFRRTSTDSRPTTPVGDQNVDDSVPLNWTDDPTGPTASLPFEWIASRSGTTGAWGLFSQPGLFSLYAEPIDLGGTPLAPTLSVSAGGGRRAGYLFRVDIGFGGALNQKGIRKCQLQIDASSSFTTPINVDVELPRPPNAQWFTLHGFQRWYFRARVYNEPADVWSSWSTTRDAIGAFAEEDSGLPGAIRDMNVSAEDTANLVSVQFQEPATNSRTIWGYEIQARDPGFSPPFAASPVHSRCLRHCDRVQPRRFIRCRIKCIQSQQFQLCCQFGSWRNTLYFRVSQHGYRRGQISVCLSDRIEYVR